MLSLVLAAFPGRQMGLPFFNDHRCGSVAELRSVIEKAHAFALENAEHECAAAMLKRRLLAELERERAARRAAGDTGETYILRPDVPCARAPCRLDHYQSRCHNGCSTGLDWRCTGLLANHRNEQGRGGLRSQKRGG